MYKSQEEWEEYLRDNPTEIIGAVALLLSHFNISVTPDENEETDSPGSNPVSE